MRPRRAKPTEDKDHSHADKQIDKVQYLVFERLRVIFRDHGYEFVRGKGWVELPYCNCNECERFRLWTKRESQFVIDLEAGSTDAECNKNGLDSPVEQRDD